MKSHSSQFAGSIVDSVKGRGRSLAVLFLLCLGLSFHAFGQEATILGPSPTRPVPSYPT